MKFVKIFPQRVVIEDKAFAERYSDLTSEEQLQLRFITKHDVSLSDFLTSTGEVISREKSAGFGDGTVGNVDFRNVLIRGEDRT